MLALVGQPNSAIAVSKIALVIGNSNYLNASALENPTNDARLMADTLGRLGFRVIHKPNLSQADFRHAMGQFTDQVTSSGKDTIALFYYAGHGVQFDGGNYLVPTDANIKTERDIVLNSVAASALLKAMELAGASVNVIILDACRDNPFKGTTRALARGLTRMDAPPGSIIAYATAPGQTASDGSGNSPYTLALAETLVIPNLTLEQLFKQVRVKVHKATGGTQTPWEESSLTEDVMLAGSGQATSPAVRPPPETPTLSSSSDASAAQRAYMKAVERNTIEAYDEFIRVFPNSEEAKKALVLIQMLADEKSWQSALQQGTVGGFLIYLQQHPTGTYAGEAQRKIDELKSPSAPSLGQQVINVPQTSSPEPEQPIMEEAPGYDAYGFDYRLQKNVSYEACKSACLEDFQCKALTYNRDAAWCFLKSDALLLMRNSASDAAFDPDVKNKIRISGITVYPKTDFPGYDYYYVRNTDFGNCFLVCEQDPRCRAFSFARKNRSCWLKSDLGTPKVNRGVDSGTK